MKKFNLMTEKQRRTVSHIHNSPFWKKLAQNNGLANRFTIIYQPCSFYGKIQSFPAKPGVIKIINK